MQAEELLRLGKVNEALAALKDAVKARPADAKLRVFLFQMFCVTGEWERAMTQLNVAAEMDPANLLMAQVCSAALNAEALRAQIFAGQRLPLMLGEPAEWMGWLVQANQLAGAGKLAQGAALRDKALEAAPTTAGTIDGKAFEWISDADQRLGPMLEAIIEGKYYWVPFTRIKQIDIEPPKDLRDVVWLPAHLTWTTGADQVALLPVRYPGSERSSDPAIQLARKTDWSEREGWAFGLGQRLFATDVDDFPILQARRIVLDNPAPGADAPKEG
jgi:type VI secretion system protein ImpE